MQNTLPVGRPHRNHGLFSDHYLNVTLPARFDWKVLVDDARPAMEEVARLLDSYTPSENEAQVVFHYTPEGEVTAIDSEASKPVDLSLLQEEGFPVGVSPATRQQSKAV
jgi:hypothetical protein